MKRAAAVVALVVVPMISFAQVVVYAANNPGARGHAMARRIVAPFIGHEAPLISGMRPADGAQASPGLPGVRDIDTSALLPVPAGPVFPLESESVRARTASETLRNAMSVQGAPLQIQAQERQPSRARIAALTREHQPGLVNGTMGGEYVVMVVDAAERYVWSTVGSGNMMIAIAGDTRTADERGAYNRAHRAEFTGDTLALVPGAFSRTEGSIAAGVARSASGGGRGDVRTRADTASFGREERRISGRYIPVDSLTERVAIAAGSRRLLGRDSTQEPVWVAAGTAIAARGGRDGAVDSARATSIAGVAAAGGRVLVGEGQVVEGRARTVSTSATLTYRHGFMSTRNGAEINRAEGLVAIENDGSGIEGLPAASVAGAESYIFPAGELAPSALRIVLVRLTPDAAWSPR